MTHSRNPIRSIKQLQSFSETRSAAEKLATGGFILRLSEGSWMPKHCQWIAGDPTPKEIRRHGSDHFKCMAATVKESSYCEQHYKICYTPLTAKRITAPSDE